MRNTGLKIGRRKASGFRVVECATRIDLAQALAGLVGSDMQVARRLLRRTLQAVGPYGVRLKPQETPVALQLAVTGILECEEKAQGTAAQPRWVPWRAGLVTDAVVEAKEALGVLDADHERRTLIAEVEDTEATSYEVSLLHAVAAGTPLSAPEGSRCRSRSWSVYSAALRGLAEWDRVRQTGVKPSSREVAARSLGSSKAWTLTRMKAFEDMSGLAFDEAMSHTEPTVKLRGPIRWAYRGLTGDGLSAHPWVGLPASMVTSFEILECTASAALVIENEKTFEAVLRRTDLSEHVVIVFGGGFLGEAEVSILRQLEVPIFAWGDLDPKGIQIVINIADRVGQPVTPVLMEPDLLGSPGSTVASADNIRLAAVLSTDGASSLSRLAAAIAARGLTVEQEALHDHVDELSALVTS